MSGEIEVIQYGIIHAIANCEVCEWSCAEYRDMGKTRQEIRKHVNNTGHSVTLETGKATRYKRRNSA